MLVIQMYLWKPSGCIMLISVVWTSLRQFGYEMEAVQMFYAYKCRLDFLEVVRIWEARHVYPDGNACHVSPWGVWHVFSGGGVPTGKWYDLVEDSVKVLTTSKLCEM